VAGHRRTRRAIGIRIVHTERKLRRRIVANGRARIGTGCSANFWIEPGAQSGCDRRCEDIALVGISTGYLDPGG
jgi:hypothetical protein